MRAMGELGARRVHPVLKELVVEASQALARLDADRLEELALTCQVLNRDLNRNANGDAGFNPALASAVERRDLASQAREAVADLAVFGRVLEATRANLQVMCRLRDLRQGRREYGNEQGRGSLASIEWIGSRTENKHGDN
jgi:hypothetical protein